mmetsp:Transcript_23222/g.37236  ORF Transcript_23222/g.37236 Transcript_23222/m.37236 type:complete len:218 (-) Transcript_23222:321-974(-)
MLGILATTVAMMVGAHGRGSNSLFTGTTCSLHSTVGSTDPVRSPSLHRGTVALLLRVAAAYVRAAVAANIFWATRAQLSAAAFAADASKWYFPLLSTPAAVEGVPAPAPASLSPSSSPTSSSHTLYALEASPAASIAVASTSAGTSSWAVAADTNAGTGGVAAAAPLEGSFLTRASCALTRARYKARQGFAPSDTTSRLYSSTNRWKRKLSRGVALP